MGTNLSPSCNSIRGIKYVDFTGVSSSTASADHLDPLTIISMPPVPVIICDDVVCFFFFCEVFPICRCSRDIM